MHSCSRRAFMKGGALGLFGVGLAGIPHFLVRAAHAQAPASRPKVLIAVFQRGAVDGLSMVVPHGDADYYAARTTTAIERPAAGRDGTAVELDGFFGFHPALSPLKPLWDARRLAVVHACGSPDTTRSHFDAQDYMESGTPGVKSTADGWLARGVQAIPRGSASPLRAVSMGPQLPRILRGDAGAVAMGSIADFDVKAGSAGMAGTVDARRGFESMYERGVRDLIYGTGRETFEAVKMLRTVSPQSLAPANGAQYPRGRFGESLKQIAQLVRADVGVEVAFADTGGWDTHVGQGNERGAAGESARRFRSGTRRARSRPRGSDGMWWCSPCPSSAGRCGRTATAAPITVTRRPCWPSAGPFAAAGCSGAGQGCGPISSSRVATSRSRPTFGSSSPRSLSATWACPPRRRCSPASRPAGPATRGCSCRTAGWDRAGGPP